MIVPILIGGSALAGLGGYFLFRKPKLNPEQQMVYDVALATDDPAKLEKIASVFHSQGFPDHAMTIRQRIGGPKLITVGGKKFGSK